MVYELNHAASIFVDYVIIQYSQATPKPTALAQNIIFYLFFCLNVAQKTFTAYFPLCTPCKLQAFHYNPRGSHASWTLLSAQPSISRI